MDNEKANQIIDRVIDFLYNKPLKNDMNLAESLINELKKIKVMTIPNNKYPSGSASLQVKNDSTPILGSSIFEITEKK